MKIKLWTSLFIGTAVLLLSAGISGAGVVYDVPRVEGVTVDASPADWAGQGFQVNLMGIINGSLTSPDNFDPRFRLGWNEEGLLLLVTVKDDDPSEHEHDSSLHQADCLEIFVAEEKGDPNFYQLVIAPGADPAHPEMRWRHYDHRAYRGKKPALETVQAARKTPDGYCVEVLLPWKNLPIEPEAGREAGFQLYVCDRDGAGKRTAVFFPRTETHINSSNMHRIRLAENASPAVQTAVMARYKKMREVEVEVASALNVAGLMAEVREGEKLLAESPFKKDKGRFLAQMHLPMPLPGQPCGPLKVTMEGLVLDVITLPDADMMRAKKLMEQKLVAQPFVFSGGTFPECDFARPYEAEALIGPYRIETAYYDRSHHQVEVPEKPGRYGAVVSILPENGPARRRYVTLYKSPVEFHWRDAQIEHASLVFDEKLGVDPGAAGRQAEVIGDYFKNLVMDSYSTNQGSAVLLAGLSETAPDGPPLRPWEDAWAMDRQWWVTMKRKLGGLDDKYAGKIDRPKKIEGELAPVIRNGSLDAAGMKPGAAEAIDAAVQSWAGDSGAPCGVCVARHGVIVLHKAYGELDGKPLTLETPLWMASITKLLSATLMMMLVDEGLVKLDAPVAEYLPAFQGYETDRPLTARDCYTHINGLWGHWGDDLNDFDQLIGEYYPYLEIGEKHQYNGAGYALGGKIIEVISGEAIPQFYRNHLLAPLGCEHTNVTDTCGGSRSVPMDIARIGQMLLNRGAYGDMRFFSEETFEKMLPVNLSPHMSQPTETEWGIGMTWMGDEGLSGKAFGHGAASSAILIIDPELDLVIVMTRDRAGDNYDERRKSFIKAIADNIAR